MFQNFDTVQFDKQEVGVQIILKNKQTQKTCHLVTTVQVLALRLAEEEQFMSPTGFTMCRPSAECAPGLFTATVEITALSAGGVYSRHTPDLSLFWDGFWEVHIIIRLSFSYYRHRFLSSFCVHSLTKRYFLSCPSCSKSLSSCFHALNIMFNIYFYFDGQPFSDEAPGESSVCDPSTVFYQTSFCRK